MKIVKPDYSKHPRCYYCEKNEADESSGNTEEFYCVSKTNFASYDYIPIKVEVPRCKICAKKHAYSCLPIIICFLGLFVFLTIKFIVPQWLDADFFGKAILLFTMFLLSCIGGGIVGYIPRYVISKFEDSTSDYPPIKKLRDMGFSKEKPKAHTHPEARFNKVIFEKTIKSIIEEDSCMVIK